MMLEIPDGPFDAFLFDCDGTIADTMPLHYEAWREALAEHACEFPEALFYQLGGVPTPKIVEFLNQRHGHNLPVEETVHRKEELFLARIPRILPIEPVVGLVHAYHGKLPLAVVSGGMRALVTRTLETLGLLDRFAVLVTAEDVRHGKPHPEPFLLAAERLGVEPARCLVLEDSPTGIEAARAAGMRYVLVPPPGLAPDAPVG